MNTQIQEVMNTKIETVPETMPVYDLASFFLEREISGAPVVDENQHLVGVVSLKDIAQYEVDGAAARRKPNSDSFFASGWQGKVNREDFRDLRLQEEDLLVQDIMTPTVYSVPYNTPVQEVAQAMYTGRIHRLLVTQDKHVVGMVTSLDLLRFLFEE